MLEWSDSFTTKTEIVDSQHQKLFDLLNKLAESYKQHGSSVEMIDEALTQLIAYADQHFKDEEALMRKNNLDSRHINIHHMEHNSFIYDAEKMSEYLLAEDNLQEMTEKLVSFITSWLTYHILGTDQVMTEQITAIQKGVTPEQAYASRHAATYDVTVTRLMLSSVLELWRSTAQRCHKLEEKLAVLNNQADVSRYLNSIKSTGTVAINSHPQFITDENGKRLQAVIPFEEYLELTKNLADLAGLTG